MSLIRPCGAGERDAILAIVNAAAEAYRGVIPADRWHEPYMSRDELDAEIGAGVAFWGHESDGALTGVMGIQPVGDVELIRHAYVLPAHQGEGIGTSLLRHLHRLSGRPMLVGTWADARWDPLLRAQRLRAREPGGEGRAPTPLLDDPGAPDRDVGGAGRKPGSDPERNCNRSATAAVRGLTPVFAGTSRL